MGRGFDQLCELRDNGIDYLKLRWTSLRLDVVDKLSDALSKALGYLLTIVLVFFALMFLMIALALWLGELLGHPSLGFLVAGGGFLLGALIMFYVGRRLMDNSMVRYLIDLFFTDKDDTNVSCG